MVQDERNSLTLLRNYIRFAVSQISFYKSLLPTSSFTKHQLCGMPLFLIDAVDDNGIITCDKGYRISQWLEKGVFPALDQKFIKDFTVVLIQLNPFVDQDCYGDVDEESNINTMETYNFHLEPVDTLKTTQTSASTDLSLTPYVTTIPEQIRNLTNSLIKKCKNANSHKHDVPDEKQRRGTIITFVMNYTDKAPHDISPDFFSRSKNSNLFGETKENAQNEYKHSSFESPYDNSHLLQVPSKATKEGKAKKRKNRQKRVCLGSFSTGFHRLTVSYCHHVTNTETKLGALLKKSVADACPKSFDEHSAISKEIYKTDKSNNVTPMHLPEFSAASPPKIKCYIETKLNNSSMKEDNSCEKRTPTSILKSKKHPNVHSPNVNKKLRISPFTPTPPSVRKKNARFQRKLNSSTSSYMQQDRSPSNMSHSYSEDPTLLMTGSALTFSSCVTPSRNY